MRGTFIKPVSAVAGPLSFDMMTPTGEPRRVVLAAHYMITRFGKEVEFDSLKEGEKLVVSGVPATSIVVGGE